MSEFDDIQKLLRLKRYEQPPEGYYERFAEEFKERQRSEILRISSRGLLIERVHTWIWSTGTRRWLAAGSATSALVVAGFFLIPDSMPDTPSSNSNSAEMEKIEEPKPATPSQAEAPESPAKR